MPLHALLVPFPIVCFIGALVSDVTYISSDGYFQWANLSEWLLAFGEATGALAALVGLIDLMGNEPDTRPREAWLHFVGMVVVLALGLLNNLVHARDGWTGIAGTGITLSALTVAVMLVATAIGLRLAAPHARERA